MKFGLNNGERREQGMVLFAHARTILHKVHNFIRVLQSVHNSKAHPVHLFATIILQAATPSPRCRSHIGWDSRTLQQVCDGNNTPIRTSSTVAHCSHPTNLSLSPPQPRPQNAFRPPKPAASRRPTPQLRPNPLNCLHDVERALRNRRLALSHRRCPLRLHGTRIPARRFVIFVEQEFL